jgi:serine/threonine-protein kinase RsbT
VTQLSVLTTEQLPIRSEADIAIVRRRARELALAQRFDPFATAAITTAASELSRNALVHGGGGRAEFETITSQDGRPGLRIRFVDHGPGMADVERALRGGWSTGRSLGLGLSGSRRLVDEFLLESAPGSGTRVEVVKWSRIRH